MGQFCTSAPGQFAASLNSRRGRGGRKLVREALQAFDLRPPSDFEVSSRQLITFHPLDDAHGPFANVIELGTVTPLRPHEFYGLDEDRERVFKSLLRLTLQQKLYRHKVQWMAEHSWPKLFPPMRSADRTFFSSQICPRAKMAKVKNYLCLRDSQGIHRGKNHQDQTSI